jgi:hypothetical protein
VYFEKDILTCIPFDFFLFLCFSLLVILKFTGSWWDVSNNTSW